MHTHFRKLRILHLQTVPLYGSGSGTYVRYLATETARNHQVGIVAPDDRAINGINLYTNRPPFQVAFTGHPEWPNCKLYKDLSDRELTQLYLSFFETTIQAIEDFHPEILHVHHLFPLSWVAHFVQATRSIPYIVTCHGSELTTIEQNQRYYMLTVNALRRAAQIIPNSLWTRKELLKLFGKELSSHVTMIPGGVDINEFNPKLDCSDVDKLFNTTKKKVVAYAGRLTRKKGVQYLIEAARNIFAEVIIIGDGPEKRILERMARSYRLTNVHFAGYFSVDSILKKLICRADILVSPSIWEEPLGLVLLEAMACETPVVVTRTGGVSLIVKDGVNGYFVNPKNANEIAEKVNELLADDEARKRMGINARRSVKEKFSWSQIAQRFEHVYYQYAINSVLQDNSKQED